MSADREHPGLRFQANTLAQALKDFTRATDRMNGEILALSVDVGLLLVEAFVRPEPATLLQGIRWIYEGGTLCAGVLERGVARLAREARINREALRASNDRDGAPTGQEVNQAVARAVAALADPPPETSPTPTGARPEKEAGA